MMGVDTSCLHSEAVASSWLTVRCGSRSVGYTDIADYGGDNPVSARADTIEPIHRRKRMIMCRRTRRMAVKAGYGADMTGPIAPGNFRWPRSPPPGGLAMARTRRQLTLDAGGRGP